MEVASAVAWSRQAATAKLALAREMLELPNVYSSLSRGAIDLPKARVFCEETRVLPRDTAGHVCDQLLPEALRLTTGQLRAKLARLVLSTDPDAAAMRHKQKTASRRLVFEPDRDGCASLLGLDLPADRARAAANAVHTQARLARANGDTRSMGQLRADIFLDLLSGKPSSGRGGIVELTASLQMLTQLAETPGDLAGYGPVIADVARKVAAQQGKASWTYTVHDPETAEAFHGTTRARPTQPDLQRPQRSSPGTATQASRQSNSGDREQTRCGGTASRSQPTERMTVPGDKAEVRRRQVESTAEARRATAEVARIVRARDRRCRAPGCRVPASRCDLDHRQSWVRGGRSEPCNLAPLCRYHHRARHEGGWRYRRTKRGGYVWRSPLGRIYEVEPEPP